MMQNQNLKIEKIVSQNIKFLISNLFDWQKITQKFENYHNNFRRLFYENKPRILAPFVSK